MIGPIDEMIEDWEAPKRSMLSISKIVGKTVANIPTPIPYQKTWWGSSLQKTRGSGVVKK